MARGRKATKWTITGPQRTTISTYMRALTGVQRGLLIEVGARETEAGVRTFNILQALSRPTVDRVIIWRYFGADLSDNGRCVIDIFASHQGVVLLRAQAFAHKVGSQVAFIGLMAEGFPVLSGSDFMDFQISGTLPDSYASIAAGTLSDSPGSLADSKAGTLPDSEAA